MPEGPLAAPRFAPLPPPKQHPPGPRKPYRYEKLLDIVREHPKQPACIAKFTEGGKKATSAKLNHEYGSLRTWLNRNRPLEDWDIHRRTAKDSWCDRELWVTFQGYMTEVEAKEMRAFRKTLWQRNQQVEDRQATKQAREAMRAMRAANRVREERAQVR